MQNYFASLYFCGDGLRKASNIKFKIFKKIFALTETKNTVVLRERKIVFKNISKTIS